jgi:hypothetical protein
MMKLWVKVGVVGVTFASSSGCAWDGSKDDSRWGSEETPVGQVDPENPLAELETDEGANDADGGPSEASSDGLGGDGSGGGNSGPPSSCDCDPNARPFGGGDGSATPYSICAVEHLENVSTAPAARFVLTRDLNLCGVEDFVPLGATSSSSEIGGFSGEFDGDGYALEGLVIDRGTVALGTAEDHVGLFSSLHGATVKDLTLRDFTVLGGNYVGTLAGEAGTSVPDDTWIEGVVVDGGSVTAEGDYAGGLFGWMQLSDLLAVRTSCTVTGQSFVGGLAGFTWSNTVTRSSAHGAVTANVNEAGGLFGRTNEDSVFQSWATSDVSGVSRVGGLIGQVTSSDSVRESYASGNVTGESRIGALVGSATGLPFDIDNCYALGTVTATGEEVGGLIGYVESEAVPLERTYFFGTVDWTGTTSPSPTTIGALIGYLDTPLYRSVALEQTPALPLVGESGSWGFVTDSSLLSVADFADEENFPDWDFETIWIMDTEVDRPILRWQLEE